MWVRHDSTPRQRRISLPPGENMKTEEHVEVIMRDGSKIMGRLLKKRPTGIIIQKDEYYAFSKDKTISVEMYIPTADIKTINKKDLRF